MNSTDREALDAIYQRWLVHRNAKEAALDLIDHHLEGTSIAPFQNAREALAFIDTLANIRIHPMTDLEVLTAIRRHMAGIEHELLVAPPCTAVQWAWAMGEYTKEMAASFEAPATAPPVNRDVPHVQGTGAVGELLSCTMGNWDGEPVDYSFAWKRDGSVDVGSNSMNYRVDTLDVGHEVSCVVTAINAAGSTAAPPSNAIAVAAAGAARAAAPAAARPPAR